jgi:hemolysin activation/secretion protein
LQSRSFLPSSLAFVIWSIALLNPVPALSQLQQLPSSAEPGRQAPRPPELPPALTDLEWSVQLPPGAEPPPSLKSEPLELKDLRLTGVTAYSRAQLIDLFRDDLGKTITFERFYAIARAIQQRYRRDGYILSFSYVPPQSVEDGVFTIAVVEGFVEAVQIGDVEGTLKDTLANALSPITAIRPLNVRTLERYLLLANDLAGVKVTAVLRPSKSTQGATVLVAKVRRTPFGGGASIDNRSSDFTGPWGSSVSASANSLLGTGERLGLTLSEAGGLKEKKAVSATYQQPFGTEGLRIDLGVSQTDSEPGSTLAEFEVETSTLELTSDISYPVIRSRAETLSIGGGFTFRNAEVDLLGQPFNQDRLRLLRANVNYSNGSVLGGSTRIILGATQSMQIWSSTDPSTDTTSRGDADMDFAKLNLDVVYARPIGAGVTAQISMTAQYATRPTPASEEFSLGGDGFGRAYNSGELSGEDGIGFSAEFSRSLGIRHPQLRYLNAYGFYDIGKVWDRASASSLGPADSLASAGAGLRAGLPFGLTLRLEYDFPLTREPSHQNGEKHGRLFFFASWTY